mmetsp:Transcript_5684/g.16231  ORF Transcript_5684/g.16231 Transcript_5684/m.16231 type:complete len:123 (-) Transcript_5684:289-657(-)|eukprot:CAMPEP_0206150314 /NCGR_PEP_ID=MMETSP1473-20131121/38233_1 /ASSEMBLY_ACC=CAM_ASM_001109 /TAXON_ID=1461547 /ORGANISM="Stichococcus sp, Strain RCC1054" /LENGTH=122 /DNA_ID=CAMNT_0053547809 /DNA_START=126 /DNA_END=494 /DNA_ORIENTATION=+
MVAATMSASIMQAPMAMRTRSTASRSARMVVRAQSQEAMPRRAALGLIASVAGALVTGGAAQAKTKIAFQDSIQKAGSSTEASQSGYTMTGTKKRGLSPQERKELLAEAKESALASLAKTAK